MPVKRGEAIYNGGPHRRPTMAFTNALMERLGMTVPIIQAPMLGATDARIVRAVGGRGGQSAGTARAVPAAELTNLLWKEAQEEIALLSNRTR